MGYALAQQAETAAALAEITAKLTDETIRILRQPETRERLIAQGFDPIGSTADAFSAYLKSELAKWANVVKASGTKAD